MTREEIAFAAYYKATEDGMINIAKFFDIVMEGTSKMMIDKACEWLYEYNRKQADKMFGTVHTADVTINVAEFRKAMEGGEE